MWKRAEKRPLVINGIGLLLSLLMVACNPFSRQALPVHFISHFSNTAENKKWRNIECLVYELQIPGAVKALKRQLNRDLPDKEQQHARLQLIFLDLIMEKNKLAAQELEQFFKANPDTSKLETWAKGHLYFNLANLEYHHLHLWKARDFTQIALRHFDQTYPQAHYYRGLALSQLSLIWDDINEQYFGLNPYGREANEILQPQRDLLPLCWDYFLAQANQELLHRRNLEALHAVEAAEIHLQKLPFPKPIFRSRCLILKAYILKKAGVAGHSPAFEQALNLQKQALLLLEPTTSLRKQEVWREIAMLGLSKAFPRAKGDSIYQAALTAIERSIQQTGRSVFGIPAHLRALRSSELGTDQGQTILLYQQYMDSVARRPAIQRHLSEAFFGIRKAQLMLGQYEAAIQTGLKMISTAAAADPNARLEPKLGVLVASNQGPWMQTVFLAEAYLSWSKKLNGAAKWDKLRRSIELFELCDEKFLASLQNTNEDNLDQYKDIQLRLYNGALDAVFEANQLRPAEKWGNLSLRFADRLKSYLLRRDMIIPKINPKLGKKYRVYKERRDELLRKEISRKLSGKEIIEVQALESSLASIVKILRKDSIQYLQSSAQAIPTVQALRSALGPSRQVIQYALTNDYVYSIYVGPKSAALKRTKYPALHDDINRFHAILANSKSIVGTPKREYEQLGFELYQILLQPLQQQLEPGATILIVPDKSLHHLPFDALLTQKQVQEKPLSNAELPYFLFQSPILYSPSLKLWMGKTANKDPGLREKKHEVWNGIPHHTEGIVELRNILGPNTQLFDKNRCTALEFLAHIPKLEGFVHLNIHANSNISNRYDNYLRFPEHPKKHKVYGYEISKMDLSKVDLLFLAACESSWGQATAEGSYTLSRCVLESGANKVIGTQWAVNLIYTHKLVNTFYTVYAKENNVERALWHAKKEYLKNMPADTCAPYYWSSFMPIQ
jgi:CHAT domain-containing protein